MNSAKLRYQDAARDLCQIRLDDAFPSGRPISRLAASKDLEVGQQVFDIGSPRGPEHTISRGIVSALREMKEEIGNLIQTDAAISQSAESEVWVAGLESVRVPAGQFKACKIETTSERMYAVNFNVVVKCTYWYAPEVKRTVKMNLFT